MFDRDIRLVMILVYALYLMFILYLMAGVILTGINNINPKKDQYGQTCHKERFLTDWVCPSDTEQFKQLKKEGCKLVTVIETKKTDYIKQYRYMCRENKEYILNFDYKGL
ncbi:hypothetical protein [Acinetobacter seifertii]|uniref:hypothetical protein n=1 Tax=Acinetobacter seifertii TaxID=1530123 RepID=UPI001D17535D|nr:hypothetical protein [Acinetobacter seifertii]